MTDDTKAKRELFKDPAVAAPAADRDSDEPVSGLSGKQPDITDTTTILQGAAAIVGKAAWSVNRMAVRNDAIAVYEHAKHVREEREAEEARQLAHLAEWNKQMTTVGGVAMTNAEAQDARQHVIDHGDHYADWAAQQGLIRADERESFKDAMRRKKDLEDKRGRGIMTPDQEREAAALDSSHLGRALDSTTAQAYRDRGMGHDAKAEGPTANAGLRRDNGEPVITSNVFQDYEATTATAAIKPPQPPLSKKVEATGLEL